jgi:hypothetical protein
MDNEPEPFAKQIQQAVDRGQVVMVPTLTRPPGSAPQQPPHRSVTETKPPSLPHCA